MTELIENCIRSLDISLATTHGESRVFVIIARYCVDAGKSQSQELTRLPSSDSSSSLASGSLEFP